MTQAKRKQPARNTRRKAGQVPLLDATAKILLERGATHGDFTDNADTAQQLKFVARSSVGWSKLTNVQREAIEAQLCKIARIVTGNPDEPDHWRDIQGYARLAENRLPKPI